MQQVNPFRTLTRYKTAWLRQDIPAGLSVFLVALPLCLGIALASGAPLFSGLVAGMIGGIVVAVTQFFPLPQIYAGAAALKVWESVGGPMASGKTGIPLSALGAFLVTVMTATQLMVAAAMIGYVLRKAMQRANCD